MGELTHPPAKPQTKRLRFRYVVQHISHEERQMLAELVGRVVGSV